MTGELDVSKYETQATEDEIQYAIELVASRMEERDYEDLDIERYRR